MRLVEQAWLVLPGMVGISWAVAPLMFAASLAMLGFGWVGAVRLAAARKSWSETGVGGERKECVMSEAQTLDRRRHRRNRRHRPRDRARVRPQRL